MSITQTERKAFEKFLRTLVVRKVDSVDKCNEVIKDFKNVAKHVGKDFNKLMKESAIWMKQCVPGGNKKWSTGNDDFPEKDGFDILYKYAPKEIIDILESGGQELLNIFSSKYSKNVHASLKTITLGEYEDLVLRVDPSEIVRTYCDNGYIKSDDESENDFILKSIKNDHDFAFDNSCLLFNVDSLKSAKEYESPERNFKVFVYYNDAEYGVVEAKEEFLNENTIKSIAESMLADGGVNSKIEFISNQEKIDEQSFDIEFKLLTPPAVGCENGFICVYLSKPDMYKEVIEKIAVATAMSLKQKLKFMLEESYSDLTHELTDFNDVVVINLKDKNGFTCKIQAYKDGDLNVEYTDFNIELKNSLINSIKSILKQKEDWTSANTSGTTTTVLDKFELYPNDKELDVWTRFLEITREDGSKYWAIDAVDYTINKKKDLGHSKTTYRDFDQVSKYFNSLKEKANTKKK